MQKKFKKTYNSRSDINGLNSKSFFGCKSLILIYKDVVFANIVEMKVGTPFQTWYL